MGVFAQPNYDYTKLKREKLNRGLVVVKKDSNTNFLSWRYFSSDPMDISFNIYRNGSKINDKPILKGTFFEDKTASSSEQTYILKSLVKGIEKEEQKYTLPANAPVGYVNIPLDKPKDGVTPDGQAYSYSPNDASIGDVDGDGEYEIILKWDPSNAHDNSHKGYTGNVFIDCYKLNGTKLWRIDLGKNIRAGAHYTQFMVFDLDGDNKAEIVMKTADGSIDGLGTIIGDDKLDFRNSDGFILSGNEYLTIFNGETGKAMETLPYDPPRGDLMGWGDDKGNRMDRYLAAIAYLDGEHPSVVMCRGYYSRTVLAAYDWRNGKLTKRWVFDSNTPGNESYAGQGNHNLRVGDVDGDGCDEIIYGSCAIDHDGTGLYNTKLGHGDAIHLTVFDPKRKGLQVWDCHENRRDGSTYRDARTGEILFQIPSPTDVGRCMAADIDPNHPGLEMWSWGSNGIFNVKGECIDTAMQNISVNMACWWDGDLLRELLDKNKITKYDYKNGGGVQTLLTAEGCVSNNGTKATPAIQGDIVGDWREEFLLRTEDNSNLRLYVSTHPTEYRFHTFLEDPIYRISMATQNVAYNQPTQPGFYIGADLGKIFPEKEIVTGASELLLDAGIDYDSYSWSIVGDTRSRLVTSEDIPLRKRTLIKLIVTFRGYEFSDSVYVTLGEKAVSKP
nr:rhamnogalacturonan lyase [Dysgonomonas alginatilytica]